MIPWQFCEYVTAILRVAPLHPLSRPTRLDNGDWWWGRAERVVRLVANGDLACHANIDIAVVQETKFLDPDFAVKWCAGYETKTAAAGSTSCGEMTLLAKENDFARVRNRKIVGTNIILFQLVLNKYEVFLAVRGYFPPPDKEGVAQRLVGQTLWGKPAGSMPLVIGHMNTNLGAPWN